MLISSTLAARLSSHSPPKECTTVCASSWIPKTDSTWLGSTWNARDAMEYLPVIVRCGANQRWSYSSLPCGTDSKVHLRQGRYLSPSNMYPTCTLRVPSPICDLHGTHFKLHIRVGCGVLRWSELSYPIPLTQQ